jgi:hypothetical protein
LDNEDLDGFEHLSKPIELESSPAIIDEPKKSTAGKLL